MTEKNGSYLVPLSVKDTNFAVNTSRASGIAGYLSSTTVVISNTSVYGIEGADYTNLDYVLFEHSTNNYSGVTGINYGANLSDERLTNYLLAGSNGSNFGMSIDGVVDDKYRDAIVLDDDMTLGELLDYIGAENVNIINNRIGVNRENQCIC